MLRELVLVALTCSVLSIRPTSAEESMAAQTGETGLEACAAISMDPVSVANQLRAFEDVFGKNALDWTEDDYEQLYVLAEACDGVMVSGRVISSVNWVNTVEVARARIYPLAETHRRIMSRAAKPGSNDLEMPECVVLGDFKQEADIAVDNSADVFGKPFLAMTDDDLRNIVDHANQCLAFLPEFVHLKRGTPPAETTNTLNAIMDRALIMQAHREDWKYWQGRAASDVTLEIDGVEIIPTLASHDTQRMIRRYNQAARFPGGLATQTVSLLISMAEKVVDDPKAGVIDKAFAERIRSLVQEDIFDRSEFKLTLNAP